MKINFSNTTSFTQLTFKKDMYWHKTPDTFEFLDKNFQQNKCLIKPFTQDEFEASHKICIYSPEKTTRGNDLCIASNNMVFVRSKNSIEGNGLLVFDKKNRDKGLGSIMKLCQIMSMLESNMDHIYIKSVPEALLFHRRFGFDICKEQSNYYVQDSHSEIMEDLISNIQNKRHPLLEDIIKEANKIMDDDDLSDNEFIQKAEILTQKYLDTVIENKLPQKEFQLTIEHNTPMKLERAKVLENKDFYNALFRKYGIDYTIA